ncbi:MAG TPA: GNAT family N-acetyltransferase [Thermoanaerobaculia bacterium]|jgi:L-amino acid N-acyltransferase YncA|nr:GNAT family N-acetyltransferase [Thermoanaerobaculia bacterium]
MRPSDWSAVRRIYLEGIASRHGTFEERAPTWRKWNESHRRKPRLAATADGRVVAWAAVSPVSGRSVYAGVAEVSIYVAAKARGMGIGRALLFELVRAAEEAGIWTLQAGIFPENTASLAIHRRCGFRKVGRRERIGRQGAVWRDVVLLERRSRTVG